MEELKSVAFAALFDLDQLGEVAVDQMLPEKYRAEFQSYRVSRIRDYYAAGV